MKHQPDDLRIREQDKLLEEVHKVNQFASSSKTAQRKTASVQFIQEEIELIRKMIVEFKNDKNFGKAKQAYELRELKHALKYVGINPHKLIRLYWKDVSKNFENPNAITTEYPMMPRRHSSSQLSL